MPRKTKAQKKTSWARNHRNPEVYPKSLGLPREYKEELGDVIDTEESIICASEYSKFTSTRRKVNRIYKTRARKINRKKAATRHNQAFVRRRQTFYLKQKPIDPRLREKAGKLGKYRKLISPIFHRDKIFHNETATTFISKMMNNEVANIACNHYLIGSSSIEFMLSGTYTFQKNHQKFQTMAAVQHGKISENVFAQRHQIIESQPTGRSYRLPFFCCTGDFIYEDDGRKYAEVKSSTSKNMSSFFDKKNFYQVVASMTILGFTEGTMFCYNTRTEGHDVFVERLFEIKFVLKSDIFTERCFSLFLIDSYLSYLESHFKIINFDFSKEDMKCFRDKLLKRATHGEKRMILEKTTLSLQCKYFVNNLQIGVDYSEGVPLMIKNKDLFEAAQHVYKEEKAKKSFADSIDGSLKVYSKDDFYNPSVNKVTCERRRNSDKDYKVHYMEAIAPKKYIVEVSSGMFQAARDSLGSRFPQPVAL